MDGEIFRQLRLREGYSLHDAAEEVTSVATLSRFENGLVAIGTEKLVACLNNIGLTFLEFASADDARQENQYNYFNDLRRMVELDQLAELEQQAQAQRARYDRSQSTIDFHTLVLAAGMSVKAGGANVLTPDETGQVLHELRRSDVWGEIEILQFEAAAPLLTAADDLALALDLALHVDDIARRSTLLYRDAWSAMLSTLEVLVYRGSAQAAELAARLNPMPIHEEAMVMRLRLRFINACVRLRQGEDDAAQQEITQLVTLMRFMRCNDLAAYYERKGSWLMEGGTDDADGRTVRTR